MRPNPAAKLLRPTAAEPAMSEHELAAAGLLSAVEIHEVGVQATFGVWIALPAGTHAPKAIGAAFSESIETVVLDGAPVRV